MAKGHWSKWATHYRINCLWFSKKSPQLLSCQPNNFEVDHSNLNRIIRTKEFTTRIRSFIFLYLDMKWKERTKEQILFTFASGISWFIPAKNLSKLGFFHDSAAESSRENVERKNSSANTEEDSHPIKQLCLPSLRTRGGGEVEVASGFTTRG